MRRRLRPILPLESSEIVASPEPLMRLESVCRSYDDGAVPALTDVSFAVARGEYLAIMGPSGSGKSTLLNLMGALDRPSSGEIYFDGRPLSTLIDLDHFRATRSALCFSHSTCCRR